MAGDELVGDELAGDELASDGLTGDKKGRDQSAAISCLIPAHQYAQFAWLVPGVFIIPPFDWSWSLNLLSSVTV